MLKQKSRDASVRWKKPVMWMVLLASTVALLSYLELPSNVTLGITAVTAVPLVVITVNSFVQSL